MEENKAESFDPSTNAAFNPAFKPDNGYEMNVGPPPAYEQGQYRSAAPVGEVPTQPAYTAGTVVVTNVMHRQAGPILPQSYVVHNILILLFCCCLFGLIGIVKGSQVNKLYAMGQYAAAEHASQSARKWYIWGIGCGIVVYVVLFITYMIMLFD